MCDQDKNKAQLIIEIEELRQKLKELRISNILNQEFEEKPAVSKDSYLRFVDQIPVPIWMTGVEGHAYYINKTARIYWGNLEDPSINRVIERIHPEDLEKFIIVSEETYGKQAPFEIEYRFLGRNQEYNSILCNGWPYYNDEGKYAGHIGTFYDISQMKLAEAALKESEEKYRELFENANDIILLNEFVEYGVPGKFIEVNKIACQKLGYNKEEFLSMTPRDITRDSQVEVTEKIVCNLKQRNHLNIELYLRAKNGETLPVEINSHIFTLKGKMVGLAVARDISERKQVEAELMEARKKAERSERTASLGTMAAGIAHEINQPLNSIKVIIDGMLYLQKRGRAYSIEDCIKKFVEISAQADRIDKIIKGMRSFVRTQYHPLNLTPCNLNHVVDNVILMLGRQLKTQKIQVKRSLLKDLPNIEAEQYRLEEVVMNLLTNAMQAFQGVNKEDQQILIQTFAAEHVVLEVSDNATGVHEELIDKLFEPFFSTKDAGEGMGLGLTIVHSIVTSFKGQISVKSNQKGGATFTIEFPIHEV